MDKIKAELEQEFTRMKDENYQGVIFVHPDDIEATVEFMRSTKVCKEVNLQSKIIRLKGGGDLSITHVAGETHPECNHGGCQYTSILMDTRCFGKYEQDPFEFKPVGVARPEFILYMISRNRSRADCHPHTVVF